MAIGTRNKTYLNQFNSLNKNEINFIRICLLWVESRGWPPGLWQIQAGLELLFSLLITITGIFYIILFI